MKQTILYLIACFVLVSYKINAQSFAKEYAKGNSTIWQVIKTTRDNNLIAVGDYTISADAPNNIIISKLKPNGQVIWSKSYGGAIQQNGLDVTQTTDGGFVIAGIELKLDLSSFEVKSTGCIIKLSSSGDVLWSSYLQYGNQNNLIISHVTATANNGVIVGGNFTQFTNGAVLSYVYITSVNADGSIVWAKQFDNAGGRRWVAGMFIQKDVVTLITESSTGSFLTAKDVAAVTVLNAANGNVVTGKQFRLNGSGIHFIQTACSSKDGAIISGTTGDGVGAFDIWVLKIDRKLNVVWSQVIKQGADDRPNKIVEDEQGNILIGGTTTKADASFYPYIIGLDADGKLFKKILLDEKDRGAFGIATLNGNFYCVTNGQFGGGGSTYVNLLATKGNDVCLPRTNAGTQLAAPDVIISNKVIPAKDIVTSVSVMKYKPAPISFDVKAICASAAESFSSQPLTTTVTKHIISNDAIALYPNPVKDKAKLTIKLPGITYVNIAIISATGQRVLQQSWQQHGSFNSNINMAKLAAGNYILHVETNEGKAALHFVKL